LTVIINISDNNTTVWKELNFRIVSRQAIDCFKLRYSGKHIPTWRCHMPLFRYEKGN